jgi:3-oxoacyl-[acyl-carrier protein] reductase
LLFRGLFYLIETEKNKNMPAPSIHAFAEKVALITDGSNPIGRAVALQLALQGAYVIVGHARQAAADRRALEELKSLGTLASAVETDVSTVAGARALVAEVEKMFGRLDLLVNCVKYATDSAFDEITEEIFDNAVNANLKAAFFVTQEALGLMKARPKPKIVNVVSALDTESAARSALFAASQRAAVGLSESLAAGLPKNFRVNAVAVSEKQGRAENLDAELFRAKTGVAADDVARTILFLLSAEAIGLNGQTLAVE